nr:DUF2318 domain-containing protein [Desulfobulbaceae bacterium]
MNMMNKRILTTTLFVAGFLMLSSFAMAFNIPFFGGDSRFTELQPKNGTVSIPVATISDGKAHYFKVKADDGIMVYFFTLKSGDGVIRAAIDACDVCYKAGKGYVQDGDYMICENCGQRFASNKINVVKGGCNPAPLNRVVQGANLVISMKDITANSWYCKFKKQ